MKEAIYHGFEWLQFGNDLKLLVDANHSRW
jgi:hypothetical protein